MPRRMAQFTDPKSYATTIQSFAAATQSRFSDWVLVHPVLWAVGSGVMLVVLGVAINLAPILVLVSGAAIGALNILHAKRRGYCHLRQRRAARIAVGEPRVPVGDGGARSIERE